jgi:hypothetical protein
MTRGARSLLGTDDVKKALERASFRVRRRIKNPLEGLLLDNKGKKQERLQLRLAAEELMAPW